VNGLRWSTAARIAWREARASRAKFTFVILAVAVGVGALTGVRGFSTAFRGMLTREARTLMAGDLSARMFVLPTSDQEKTFERLAARGVRRTWITETMTMASSTTTRDPLLVFAKAVEPGVYPFYGSPRLEPPGRLEDVLQPDTVVVSNDVIIRLRVNTGDTLRIGGQDFRIAAVLAYEPDRMAGSLNVGARLMLSRAGLERTGLIRPGSRAAQRFVFRLPAAGIPVADARAQLKAAFPEAMIADYRETHPMITRGLDRSTRFLSLVSLIALIVGAIGVGMAIHAHLRQRLDTIAIMKCLGARSGGIMRIYLLQTAGLAAAGGAIGVGFGALIQSLFPVLIARYFQLDTGFAWDWTSVVQGLAIGILTTLLFTLPPLLAIRRIRPGVILRRDMAEARAPWRSRLRNSRAALAAAGALLAGLGLIATWLAGGFTAESARVGGYFVGGLSVSLAVLAGIAWLLMKFLRGVLRAGRWTLPSWVRHGLANLYRPGNQAQAVLVALGLGVMFTLSVYLVQHHMIRQISESAPPGMANVFLLDITEPQRTGVFDLIAAQPGVTGKPEIAGAVQARLLTVGGAAVESLNLTGFGRRFRSTRSVSWSEGVPEQAEILQGAWMKAGDTMGVAVGEDAARELGGLRPGVRLIFTAHGRTLEAVVACVFRIEQTRMRSNFEFYFDRAALGALPMTFFGGVRMAPRDVASLQRVMYDRFPTVTVINMADVLAIVQEVVDQIALVIRFISAFAILAGVIILASSVAGTRFRRIRETVILKTLGGTRRRVAGIFSVEFLVLGAVAGVMGSLLATAFSNILLVRLFEGKATFDVVPNLTAIAATALIANGSGWLASARILSQKPLEVLREE